MVTRHPSHFRREIVREQHHQSLSQMLTMQLQILLAAVMASTSLALGLTTGQAHELACIAKASGAYRAITAFCANDKIIAGSSYALAGAHAVGPKGAWKDTLGDGPFGTSLVQITGTSCAKNSVWVPKEYCASQFLEVCATGNWEGHGSKRYGANGCQTFSISSWEKEVWLTPRAHG